MNIENKIPFQRHVGIFRAIQYLLICLLGLFGCVDAQSNNKDDLNIDGYRQFKKEAQETDKSPVNDIWYGSIYRNSKYKLRIQFPEGWEHDKGMSVNTLVRTLNRELGITISVAIQHLPVDVPDSTNIFDTYKIDDFKKLFNEILESTNKSKIDQLEIHESKLNNLPAYLITAKYDLTSLDRTMTFVLRQIQCLKNSKYYNIQMVLPLDYYNDETEQLFRTTVDSFKFEFE